MKQKNVNSLYQQLMPLLSPLTYVDAGARAVKHNRFVGTFKQARYIGFELDAYECKRLNALGIQRHQFYPLALGRTAELRTLYVTRNPVNSSLYEPNSKEIYRFMECGPQFDLQDEKSIETVSLDDWCGENNLAGIEFLELDTQGSELDILIGSSQLLANSILGLQVEVEFFPLYKDQPLFADVDNYLRPLGFRLFDLSRYRLRRSYTRTRGQLIWGHAFYLKDVHHIKEEQLSQFLTLAAIASYYGVEDYAIEVLETIIKNKSNFKSSYQIDKIQKALKTFPDRFSQPKRQGFKRFWKAPSAWQVAPRKDRRFYLKD